MKMSGNVTGSSPRIHYTPRPDATPEGEAVALASIYDFAIRTYEKRKAAETADGEEAAECACAEGAVPSEKER